ncbi:tRNA1(Val) (adenine(37)-N6)-methyltransferase [Staphylococcus pseudintermedius]|uniref:tRNA1(Val) (adenine(37)-N6)-methyltransferase n=1 Tax=Staphylococcus pseudintermedius TaxID=283734 RepID=UPI001A00B1F6|nr:tRNA1(Val) (adenine(37)-N6)-methyltransferase [Staphylococcus pseudintermedius]EGQ2868678.1 tRNA1(Val) (adenine(37)-N6)-methyltransferase [Staphylococcus pseudintermedius]EGQ2892149.1 tRNA1(Val) (adenine(37)-N6)-methyltransferase [Staphylococcus pseudintermedius]EGQ3399438.1 SAM-dependent methyltransferase [Staphylococcus pseudintermedius]EGQ3904209.1 tRNA1(Val) (adenine(37)-N6)-methyltransferase [Staphylococcus pseudintermedius]EHK3764646.1 tRNA1(Val) (adenine(37)-N6)-methyltransferase [St
MLQPGERLDYLIREDLRIIQNDAVFSFSTDALLLGHFTEVRKRDRILDMCAGNGVIPLLLSDKGNNVITGVEIQPQLVNMAVRSVQYNHLEDRITMVEMDINALIQAYSPAQFDLITCNPPYFKANQTIQHQLEAHKIARHEIYCTLDDCLRVSNHLLKEGGRVVMVHRAERMLDLFESMRHYRIEPKRLHMIFSKPGKAAQTIVVEGRKGGRQGLDIAPPFYIYDEQGDYTPEMKEIYYG